MYIYRKLISYLYTMSYLNEDALQVLEIKLEKYTKKAKVYENKIESIKSEIKNINIKNADNYKLTKKEEKMLHKFYTNLMKLNTEVKSYISYYKYRFECRDYYCCFATNNISNYVKPRKKLIKLLNKINANYSINYITMSKDYDGNEMDDHVFLMFDIRDDIDYLDYHDIGPDFI